MNPDLRLPVCALHAFDPRGLLCEGPMQPITYARGWGVALWWCAVGSIHPDQDDRSEGVDVKMVDESELFLDLTDGSTRDRLARWLASWLGLAPGSTAPMWRYTGGGTWVLGWGAGTVATGRGNHAEYARAFSSDAPRHRLSGRPDGSINPRKGVLARRRIEVPTLKLDGLDDALLPDGTRVVDAVALGRCCLWVAQQARRAA